MPSENTSLQLDEFTVKISSIPCEVTLEKWQELNAVTSPVKRVTAFKAIPQKQLDALDSIANACAEELNRLKNAYSYNSIFSIVSKYRRFLAAKGLEEHPVMYFFKLNKRDYSTRRGAYKRKVSREMNELRPLFDGEGVVKRAEWLLRSDSYINVTMGLCLLSGRRPGEILQTAKFTETGEFTVRFSGQLKTKGSDNARDNYEIYLLTTSRTAIAALERLRKMKSFDDASVKPGETLGQMINRLTANGQSKSVRRYFLEFAPDYMRANGKLDKLRAYSLRPIYATLAWAWWGDTWIQTKKSLDADQTGFFADMLGHAESDTATAQSYKDFSDRFIEIKNPFDAYTPISASELKGVDGNA